MKMKKINYSKLKNERFMKFYKFLFDEQFKKMSGDAKILYTLLRDRLNLTVENIDKGETHWLDKDGNVFIYASIENIMHFMNCANQKAIKLKKELVKFGLIQEIRVGLTKANKIYLMEVNYLENLDISEKFDKDIEKSLDNSWKCENHISENSKITPQNMCKSHTNNTKYNNTKLSKTNNNYRKISHDCNNLDIKNDKPVVGVQKTSEDNTLNQKITPNPLEIIELKELFQEKTKKEVSEAYIKNLLKTFGYENIFKVLNKFKKIRPANQIENIYGFINNAVKAEHKGIPYTENTSVEAIERKKEGDKPEQSKNFEQREYDDEFFENLYDNF